MNEVAQQELANAAVRQYVVIFEKISAQGGLRIYAAPWAYMFCGKMNRLTEGN